VGAHADNPRYLLRVPAVNPATDALLPGDCRTRLIADTFCIIETTTPSIPGFPSEEIDRWQSALSVVHALVAISTGTNTRFPPDTTIVLREPAYVLVRTSHEGLRMLAATFRIRVLPDDVKPHPAPVVEQPIPYRTLRYTPASSSDIRIRNLVAALSSSSIMSQVQHLQSFQTRYTPTPGCREAKHFLAERFIRMGCIVTTTPWSWGGWSGDNIIADLPGLVPERPMILLCAHYDSTNNRGDPNTSAPGADDNASGCAALLEMARILAVHAQRCEAGIRFACFSGEEQGLLGSAVYARSLREAGVALAGVINLDMIGYLGPGAPRDVDVTGNTASQWLVSLIHETADTFTTGVTVDGHTDNTAWWSDHASFWDNGYAAVSLEESYEAAGSEFNPYYHSAEDTWEKLDGLFLLDNARTAFAAALALAVPTDTIAPEAIADLSCVPGSIPGTAVLRWTSPGTDGTSGTLWGEFLVYTASATNVYTPTDRTIIIPASGLTPGTSLQYTLAGIDGEGYYACIRVRDDFGNLSAPSNVVAIIPATGTWQNTPPNRPNDLTVDGVLANRTASTRPRFSWNFSDPDPWDYPSAYRIVVASHPAPTVQGSVLLWDSGKTPSNLTRAEYGASIPIPAETTCWWAVTAWDASDSASPWSSTSTFVVFPETHLSLTITAPADKTVFTTGETVVCHVRVDGDTSLVERVELLVDDTVVSAGTRPPYLLPWIAGGYERILRARAYTSRGRVESLPISVFVHPTLHGPGMRAGDVRILVAPNGHLRPGSSEPAIILVAPGFNDDVNITVMTLTGTHVWRTSRRLTAGTIAAIPWHGYTTSGAPVASGVYLVHVRGAGVECIRKLVAYH
jgi:hypothetical protein